jgi:hypothetical protein
MLRGMDNDEVLEDAEERGFTLRESYVAGQDAGRGDAASTTVACAS